MTAALVKQAIRGFLKTATPQVLCIRGKWGVGKTFIWEEVFKQARTDNEVALPYYCYVSLFSLQSIDEVRQTIFENRVTTRKLDVEPTLESLRENVLHYAQFTAKQASKLLPFAKLPYLDNYIANFSGGFRQVVSLAVRDTIICFDDFERKKLSAKDLLGLVSQFREQKRCKAIIILNEDALSAEERTEFDRYFEKVIDISLEFAPTSAESVDIAVAGCDPISNHIKKNAISLGISNIRIINRIKDASAPLMELLESFDETIKYQVLHTLTLFIWIKYDSGAIPKRLVIDKKLRDWTFFDKKERTEEEKKWLPVLENYKFGNVDEIDTLIIDGVEKGYFDKEKLILEAKNQAERAAASLDREAIHKAWEMFHGSFDSNAAEVVEAVRAAYKDHITSVSLGNLDEAVTMFRSLGFDDVASELISIYIDAHEGQIKSVDNTANPFHPVIKDEELMSALTAAIVSSDAQPAKETFVDIYNGKFSSTDIEAAMKLSKEALYTLFKSLKGDEIYPVIEGSLFYRRVGNATEQQKELTQRAIAALEMIGKESKLNASRVRKFAVNVGEKD